MFGLEKIFKRKKVPVQASIESKPMLMPSPEQIDTIHKETETQKDKPVDSEKDKFGRSFIHRR